MFWLLILALLAGAAYMYSQSDAALNASSARPVCILPELPDAKEEDDVVEGTSPRALISRTVESLDWLNEITKAIWPHVCAIVNKELGPTAEPLINAALPKPLKNFKFLRSELGHDCLVVDRVTVHKRFKDAVALDINISFKGKPDISMKVSPLAGSFGVEELRWSGRLSVLMRPLTTTLPCVGAIQAAFVDHPDIYLNFSGAAAFADIGPVEKVVRKVMRDVVASMVVLPNRFLFKLNDKVDFFDLYYPPAGGLLVTIASGRGFIKEKKGFIKLTPDCYCKMKFGLEKAQTHVVKKSLTPEWNTSKMFLLSDDDQPLELKCFDDDPMSDDLLGVIRLKASDLIDTTTRWVAFQKDVDKVAKDAEINLKSQAYAFTDDLSGPVMVSVLVDRAGRLTGSGASLPPTTATSQCKVSIGNKEKASVLVSRPPEPVPGVDPSNPIFNMIWDTIVPSISDANVSISLIADRRVHGKKHFDAATVQNSPDHVRVGEFPIDGGVELRCKVMLRGLTPDKAVRRSQH